MPNRIFVYGTLRQGYGNNRLLHGQKFIGKAVTRDRYELTANGIPFVNKHIKSHNVIGEVYEIDDNCQKRVDGLEGYSPERHEESWYKRETIDVILTDTNEQISADIYFNDQRGSNLIESGDYTNYK